jgi:hypothetical protein
MLGAGAAEMKCTRRKEIGDGVTEREKDEEED